MTGFTRPVLVATRRGATHVAPIPISEDWSGPRPVGEPSPPYRKRANVLKYSSDKDYALDKLGYGWSEEGAVIRRSGKWIPLDREFTNEEWFAMRQAEDEWRIEVLKAISRGDLEVDKDYWGTVTVEGGPFDEPTRLYLNEIQQGSVGPLPDRLYHVTTARSAIVEDSNGVLKSRAELEMHGRARGLGGGSEKSISFTDSGVVAQEIYDAMIEGRSVASGDTTFHHLVADASNGRHADKPWIEDWIGYVTGRKDWTEDDPWPEKLSYNAEGYDFEQTIIGRRKKPGKGDWIPIPESETAPGTGAYTKWIRKRSESANRQWVFDQFKTWLSYRENAGGPLDPLFWGTDADYLANISSDEIAILEYKSKPGATGIKMGGLSEWRTWDGTVMDLEDETYYREAATNRSKKNLGPSQTIRFMVSGNFPEKDDLLVESWPGPRPVGEPAPPYRSRGAKKHGRIVSKYETKLTARKTHRDEEQNFGVISNPRSLDGMKFRAGDTIAGLYDFKHRTFHFASKTYMQHHNIAYTIFPDLTTAGGGILLDNSVHFYMVWGTGKPDTIRFNAKFAGVYGMDLETERGSDRAFRRMYKAMDDFGTKLGVDKSTSVQVKWRGDTIRTTIGEAFAEGGPGSGHHGHAGRPGKRGGSWETWWFVTRQWKEKIRKI